MVWKLRLSIQPSNSAILFCHPLWLKGVIYQSLVFICHRIQRQCCSCWFSMLTGYQSNRETQISCAAVAKLPRKFSLPCICSPGLQRTLQWQQRIMIIHHNNPYRYAQFMYIERNICIKIYPPYFATKEVCYFLWMCKTDLFAGAQVCDGAGVHGRVSRWMGKLGRFLFGRVHWKRHAKCEFCPS